MINARQRLISFLMQIYSNQIMKLMQSFVLNILGRVHFQMYVKELLNSNVKKFNVLHNKLSFTENQFHFNFISKNLARLISSLLVFQRFRGSKDLCFIPQVITIANEPIEKHALHFFFKTICKIILL